jgi:type VI secretion system secreted protein VgrG
MPLQMSLNTPFGDQLKFRSMSALEEMSRLFELQVIAISEDPALDVDTILGLAAQISLEVADDTKRWFHGIVVAFGLEGVDGRHFTYRLTLRPWLWLLTRSSNLRIWQEMTALDIVKDVFSAYEHNLVDNTSGSYGQRVYCVQYRESDFNFVSRLLEEEGISYFFRHHEDRHDLVLVDNESGYVASAGFESADYLEVQDLHHLAGLGSWRVRHEVQPGKFTLSDYNFETPSTSLKSATVQSQRSHAQNTHEVYDYPGLYGVKADGDARAQIRADEMASRQTRITAEGNVTGLEAGGKFTLKNHPADSQNADYLVLQTQIDMRIAAHESGTENTEFACRILAQPYAEPFRPARTTMKPKVGGPQTALVVGTGGDGAIHTDEHGRIKVQFHWDRLGQKDAQSSCWMRVASQWAGNGWGMITLPRIGQEVVVDFLEGDPDQPLIVGSVHNAEQKTPYPLPDNATVSTLKSRSKQGGAADFNELRFEDNPGSEYVLLHAQKNRLEFVEETIRSEIGVDQHHTVKNDRKELVENDDHWIVRNDAKQKVEGKLHQTVVGSMLFKTDDVWSLDAAKDIVAKTGATVSIAATGDVHVKGDANAAVVAAQNVHVKGMNVVVEAATQLTLKVGGSIVVLEAAGVSIVGPMVKINSGGAGGSGSGASPVAPTAPEAPAEAEVPEDPLAHR